MESRYGEADPPGTISMLTRALHAIADSAGARTPITDLLDTIARAPSDVLGFDFGVVLLADEATQELDVVATYGLPPEYRRRFAERTPIRLGGGVFGGGPSSRAYRTMEPVAIVDCRQDRAVEQWLSVTLEFGVVGMLTTPILFDGRSLGTVNCFTRKPHVFTATEMAIVGAIAQQAALALEIARVRQDDVAQLRKLQRAHEELALRTEALRKSESIHERLRQLLLSGGRLATIAETLADALGGHILIVDPGFELLAHSYVSDSVATDEAATLASSERLAYLIDAAVAKKSSTSARDVDIDSRETVSIVPVFLMGEYVASMLAVGIDLASGGFERPALENASTLVALELLKQRQRDTIDAQARGNLVRHLLDGQFRDEAELVRVMDDAEYDFRTMQRAFVVRTREATNAAAISGEHRRRIEKRLASELRAQGLSVLSDVVRDTIVLFSPADVSVEAVVASVRSSHTTSGRSVSLSAYVGVGRASRGIARLQRSHEEATRCALLAERLQSHEPIDIAQYGVFGLLLTTSELDVLFQFSAERLSALRDHPQQLDFLRLFFAAGTRLADVAAASHIHVNTVKYRLRRIGEILNADMHSTETLMELRFALMIDDLRIVDGTASGSPREVAPIP